jgi:hypothetical protein
VIYRVEDGIPVMLPEEGIGTTQLTDFPAAPRKILPFGIYPMLAVWCCRA